MDGGVTHGVTALIEELLKTAGTRGGQSQIFQGYSKWEVTHAAVYGKAVKKRNITRTISFLPTWHNEYTAIKLVDNLYCLSPTAHCNVTIQQYTFKIPIISKYWSTCLGIGLCICFYLLLDEAFLNTVMPVSCLQAQHSIIHSVMGWLSPMWGSQMRPGIVWPVPQSLLHLYLYTSYK